MVPIIRHNRHPRRLIRIQPKTVHPTIQTKPAIHRCTRSIIILYSHRTAAMQLSRSHRTAAMQSSLSCTPHFRHAAAVQPSHRRSCIPRRQVLPRSPAPHIPAQQNRIYRHSKTTHTNAAKSLIQTHQNRTSQHSKTTHAGASKPHVPTHQNKGGNL